MRRHDLAYLKPRGWNRLMLAGHVDLPTRAMMHQWATNGWPLVIRSGRPGEAPGVPLGLPLPPDSGKRRMMLSLPEEDIATVGRPPRLDAVAYIAPLPWRPTLARIGAIALQHDVGLRVYGSLAFQHLTGLPYLTELSDLDLIIEVQRRAHLGALLAQLAAADAAAPMQIDGELMGPCGAAAKWREVLTSPGSMLVRTGASLRLGRVDHLFGPEVSA